MAEAKAAHAVALHGGRRGFGRDADIDAVFRRLDTDGDGGLTLEEACRLRR